MSSDKTHVASELVHFLLYPQVKKKKGSKSKKLWTATQRADASTKAAASSEAAAKSNLQPDASVKSPII